MILLAAILVGASFRSVNTRIAATRTDLNLGSRRHRGLPIEDHASTRTNDDGRTRGRAGLDQGIFDTDLLQSIGQVPDRFVVGEVGLLNPALGLLAEYSIERAVAAALGGHPKAAVIDSLRTQHDTRRLLDIDGGLGARGIDEPS